MNIRYKTLQHSSIGDLTAAFNAAFKNYFVNICLTEEQLATKFQTDGVRLDLSVGAFDKDKLVGFIFHGTDDQTGNLTAYNAGTGVIPTYRGKYLPSKMYEFILPVLKNAEVKKIMLEAITENKRAINIYESLGFSINRKVDCYKGNVELTKKTSLSISQGKVINQELIMRFWDVVPTWQNACISLKRQKEQLIQLTVEKEDEVIAYLVLQASTGKVMQFAVQEEYRGQGIATTLFQHAAEMKNPLVLINVDNRSEAIAAFLKRQGLAIFLSQYEMSLFL